MRARLTRTSVPSIARKVARIRPLAQKLKTEFEEMESGIASHVDLRKWRKDVERAERKRAKDPESMDTIDTKAPTRTLVSPSSIIYQLTVLLHRYQQGGGRHGASVRRGPGEQCAGRERRLAACRVGYREVSVCISAMCIADLQLTAGKNHVAEACPPHGIIAEQS